MIILNYLKSKGILRVKGLISGTRYVCPFCFSLLIQRRDFFMPEKRLAIISIIVEDREASPSINSLLSAFGGYVVGRMGIPYKEKGVSIICIVVDAPAETINTITGRLGMLSGVTAKTLMSKI